MKNRRISIWMYIIITFVVTWTYEIWVVCPQYANIKSADKEMATIAILLVSTCMFIPALCSLVVRILRHDWDDCRLRLHLRGNTAPYLFGWFGPLLLTVVGGALWFVLNPDQFVFNASGVTSPWTHTGVLVISLIMAPIVNLIPSFGEEWGWRGFLMPRLCEQHSFGFSAVVTGFIWGLWHAPLIAMGHNYGKVWGEDSIGMVLAAIGAMIVFCIVISFIFGLIAEKAQSVWPAALAHGCMNGSAQLALMFTPAMANIGSADYVNPYNSFVGPLPMGIVGGFAFVVTAVWIAIGMARTKRR